MPSWSRVSASDNPYAARQAEDALCRSGHGVAVRTQYTSEEVIGPLLQECKDAGWSFEAVEAVRARFYSHSCHILRVEREVREAMAGGHKRLQLDLPEDASSVAILRLVRRKR